MAGSGQETDPISGKKMTSRLKLRKKKYPPPFEDPKNKDTEDIIIKQDHKTTESCIKTNTSSTNTSKISTSKISTSKINTSKTYADIVGGSRKTVKENKIFMNSKANAQKHNLIKSKNTEDVNINKDQLIIENCRKTNTSKTNTSTTNNRKTFAEIVGGSRNTGIEDDIFTKAKASAQKHNIKLKAGSKDRGFGNCVFESVINNINERACFEEKLKQTPNWYRRTWMNEMMNRIIDGICPWNLSYTESQIREGFEQVKESGVYEVDFFGDMMIGGIACAIKRIILIFNTSENLLHDPISV